MGSFDEVTGGIRNAAGEVSDGFSQVTGPLGGALDLFNGSLAPSTLGYGTRQSKLGNNRTAYSTRNVIHWVVPEGPIIQMYINPQSIRYSYQKDVPATRTKGGYLMQYFGPQLPKLTISGTTGTSGIEGINVLYDLYRHEQLVFDPYALYMAAENFNKAYSENIFGADSALSQGAQFVTSLIGQSTAPFANMQPPSLADLAFRIEMYYSGEVYRGFFTDFSVNEDANDMGMFKYDMGFSVTQKRGFRQNFFAWHRSANDGPSNTDPQNGVPYNYSSLLEFSR